MEKFEMDGEKNLEIFSGFVSNAKNVLTSLIDKVKTNIKDYESKIEDTSKEITDNEISREKCEHEITKMDSKIESIKDTIENVENTYKKMVDAYSSTSKGETKELYSEIIDGARANCEKDVEKNRSEIARLNSDIEAIKNNIGEFTKIIDELNKDLENYNLELFRYTKALEYLEKSSSKTIEELEIISNKKDTTSKKSEAKSTKKQEPKRANRTKDPVIEEPESPSSEEEEEVESFDLEEKKSSILDSFEPESFATSSEPKAPEIKKQEPKEEKTPERDTFFEDSLKQIYNLTGYKPSQKEEVKTDVPKVEETKKEEPIAEQPVYTENLENLFATASKDVKVENDAPKIPDMDDDKEFSPFLGDEFSSWENFLNSPNVGEEAPLESIKPKSIDDGMEDTANQLLTPYGTSYSRLKSLISGEILYRDGTKKSFDMTSQDVIKAVNAVDGNDLKKMKTVGPEITLLRKIKEMKEGSR